MDNRRRGDRAVEGARLEIVCTPKEYRGFESPPLRHDLRLKNSFHGFDPLLVQEKSLHLLASKSAFCAATVQVFKPSSLAG